VVKFLLFFLVALLFIFATSSVNKDEYITLHGAAYDDGGFL